MNKHYDLIVVGGGPSGFAAALACARQQKKVLIVEESNALGGAMNTMLVLPFMPYYTPTQGCAHPIELVRGIFSELVDRQIEMMKDLDGDDAIYATRPMSYFHDEYMKILMQRMAKEANIDILFHTRFLTCTSSNGTVKSIEVAGPSDRYTLTADYFIDATGNAELAYKAGFPTQLGRETDHLCQPMTMCFRVGDVDVPKFFQNRGLIQKLYKEAKERGEITNPREDVLFFQHVSPTVMHFNTTRIIKRNPVDTEDLTQAELEAREQVLEMFRFLKKYAPGCEHATLLSSSQYIGIRESRMIVGEYVLTTDDVLSCTKFDDGICACNYDIDIHNPEGTGTSHHYFEPYTYYTIPYRSLLPKGTKNLLVAGRCISSTHEAQASYRVIPFACGIGEAAGVACGIAHTHHLSVQDISREELLNTLRREGAFVEKELDL